MALHRDIYWVGRQWAVTGYGVQAVDQKLKGKFDIEASRLWEDGLSESVRAEQWFNAEDFDKALAAARKRYPGPPRKARPPEASVLGPIETVLRETGSKQTNPKEPAIEALKPPVQKFDMRIDSWPAKFVRQWRIRVRR
jgi:hypothetical protein